MEFEEQLRRLSERIQQMKKDIKTEEATKTSMVMPFFQILGYDVFNPLEFVPEYVADIGLKKGEKVDYAIMDDAKKPIILIEAKSCSISLDKHTSQLFRYFSTTPASKVAILTNGIEYRFYMDIEEENKMDSTPFYSFNILEINPNIVQFLEKYRKTAFNIANIRATASELTYNSQIKQIFAKQTIEPDDEFVTYVLSQMYDGRRTKKTIDQFRGIVKKAFVQFISDKVNERLKSALNSNTDEEPNKDTSAEILKVEQSYTAEETEAFDFIQKLFGDKLNGHKLTCKKTSNYFVIGIDNNFNKWLCRLSFGEDKIIFLPIPSQDKPINRRKIRSSQDILYYEKHILSVLEKYVGDS